MDFPATTHGGPVTPFPFRPLHPREDRLDEKQRLRATLRALRREHVAALHDATRGLLFLRPPAPVAALVPEGSIVGLYHATPNEAPTRGYGKWLLENGRRIALPWFADRGGEMHFRIWSDPWTDEDLEPGPHGTLQPAAYAEEIRPSAVFVPLVGFTAKGARLGQGGGHYDRWLADNPQVTPIGLAWDCQFVDILPEEPHDRRMRAVVTPTRFFQGEDDA